MCVVATPIQTEEKFVIDKLLEGTANEAFTLIGHNVHYGLCGLNSMQIDDCVEVEGNRTNKYNKTSCSPSPRQTSSKQRTRMQYAQ